MTGATSGLQCATSAELDFRGAEGKADGIRMALRRMFLRPSRLEVEFVQILRIMAKVSGLVAAGMNRALKMLGQAG